MGNSKPVLVVESPAKAKTIEALLKNSVKVVATYGHILDLPKNKLGVDIENGYTPQYEIIKGRKKLVSRLKKELKNAPIIYLAADPDREGESIAWQVVTLLNLSPENYKRAVFHEITAEAIKKALEAPRGLDNNLIEAQRARRILDRLIGYPLSQLLWHKIRYGLSAGRVQSAALRLIVEREEEIKNFSSEKFIEYISQKGHITYYLADSKLKKLRLKLDQIPADLKKLEKDLEYVVQEVKFLTQTVNPPPPFDTASLQQEANRKLGFSAKTTMRIAQELYQGIDIPGVGRKGLITYMRTDSYTLSKQALNNIRIFIRNRYGTELLNPTIRIYKTKSKVAQEAHEAIRPVYFSIPPEKLRGKIPEPHLKLYSLIWKRTVQTQMKPAEYTVIQIFLTPTTDALSKAIQGVKGQIVGQARYLTTPGYLTVNDQAKQEIPTDSVPKANDKLTLKFTAQEVETKPPARYTDASLVKKLKSLGIGRPSTYATIISILQQRGYTRYNGRYIHPTDTGILVINFLKKYFPEIVDYKLTAKMEDQLDAIANGKLDRVKMLQKIHPPLQSKIEKIEGTVQKQDVTTLEQTQEPCPLCGKSMLLKVGRYGKYYSCPDYPKCKGIKPYLDTNLYVIPPEAQSGEFVLKSGPYGMFWAHKDYPKVKKTLPLLRKETCPKCGAHLVERRNKRGKMFLGCSNYPKCDFINNRV